LLFAPTIGAALAACYRLLWVRCPACRTIQSVDLREVDRHTDAAVTSLIPELRAVHADPIHRSPSSCGNDQRAPPGRL
jgi:hypothetical protein